MRLVVHEAALAQVAPIPLSPLWTAAPKVAANLRLVRDGATLVAKFSVVEPQLRRMVTEHNGPVWEDSCVELFLQRSDSEEYVNIECSASTAMLVGRGTERAGRELFDPAFIESIPTTVTLLENSNAQSRWSAQIHIDLLAFGLLKAGEEITELALKGNFYKCGDALKEPHHLAAAEILTPKPDFHRPEFFIPISFA